MYTRTTRELNLLGQCQTQSPQNQPITDLTETFDNMNLRLDMVNIELSLLKIQLETIDFKSPQAELDLIHRLITLQKEITTSLQKVNPLFDELYIDENIKNNFQTTQEAITEFEKLKAKKAKISFGKETILQVIQETKKLNFAKVTIAFSQQEICRRLPQQLPIQQPIWVTNAITSFANTLKSLNQSTLTELGKLSVEELVSKKGTIELILEKSYKKNLTPEDPILKDLTPKELETTNKTLKQLQEIISAANKANPDEIQLSESTLGIIKNKLTLNNLGTTKCTLDHLIIMRLTKEQLIEEYRIQAFLEKKVAIENQMEEIIELHHFENQYQTEIQGMKVTFLNKTRSLKKEELTSAEDKATSELEQTKTKIQNIENKKTIRNRFAEKLNNEIEILGKINSLLAANNKIPKEGDDLNRLSALTIKLLELEEDNIEQLKLLYNYLDELNRILEKSPQTDILEQKIWIEDFKNNFHLLFADNYITKPLAALNETTIQFTTLKNRIKETIEKNSFTIDKNQTLKSRVINLKNQCQQFEKNVRFIKDWFSEDEILEFKTQAKTNYTAVLNDLLQDIYREISEIPAWKKPKSKKDCSFNENLLQQMEELKVLAQTINCLDHEENNPYYDLVLETLNKYTTKNLEDKTKEHARILSRFNCIETTVAPLIQYLLKSTHLSQRDKARIGMSQFVAGYLEDEDPTPLKTELSKLQKGHSSLETQSFIKQALLAIEDEEHFSIEQANDIPTAKIMPLLAFDNSLTSQIKILSEAIAKMKDYGEKSAYGRHKTTINLAEKLNQRLNIFVAQNQKALSVGKIDSKILENFQRRFRLHLHTQDHEMHNNRGFFHFLKLETSRSLNIRLVERALDNLVAQESTKLSIYP